MQLKSTGQDLVRVLYLSKLLFMFRPNLCHGTGTGENQGRLQELMRTLQQSGAHESEARTFIREIRQYAAIQELDETVLNHLISRILVGEVKKVDSWKI